MKMKMKSVFRPLSINYSRYCIKFAYKGKYFAGWHKDDIFDQTYDLTNIQKINIPRCLEIAISKFTNNHYENIAFSSRTDSGVHALSNSMQVDIIDRYDNNSNIISDKNIVNGINFHIPVMYKSEIQILDAKLVDEKFDARISAVARSYMYRIVCANQPLLRDDNIFHNDRAWHIKQSLNVNDMKKAASYLLGEHDFSSFRSSSCRSSTAYRNIHHINITTHSFTCNDNEYNYDMISHLNNSNDQIICIWITANSFVYHMVRNIVGLLVDIGKGKYKPEEMKNILEMQDRNKYQSNCAPPHGLYLVDVHYDYSFTKKFNVEIVGYRGNNGGL